MMAQQQLGYSDLQLIPVLRRLIEQKKPLTIDEISRESGVPYSTARRRLEVLADAGIITRKSRGKRWGSHFQLVDAVSAAV